MASWGGVFPAYAGVFLQADVSDTGGRRVPRIRGGVPMAREVLQYAVWCSPHVSGSDKM